MKTNLSSAPERAHKRLENVKGFYSHLAIWAMLNLFLFIGRNTLHNVDPDFWDVTFAVITVLGGLGVLGHFMGVFGYRIFFSEAKEKRALKTAYDEMEQENTKINQTMENSYNTDQLAAERARRRVKALKGFYKHLAAYIVVNAALLITSYYKSEYLHNEHQEFWSFQTFSTAIFWGIGLLCHAFNTFGTGILLGKDWEERKIKEFMDGNNRNTATNKWE